MAAPRTDGASASQGVATLPRAIRTPAAGVLRVLPRHDFVLLVSPSEIDLVHGKPLPRLIRFPIDPGLMGVPPVKNPGDPIQWEPAALRHCRALGRLIVDPLRYKLDITAFGQKVKPGDQEDLSDPRTWYVRSYAGYKGTVNVSVWQRPRTLGGTVIWEHDKEGEIEFLLEIAEKMFGGGDPAIKEAVLQEAKQNLRNLEDEARHRPRLQANVDAARAALEPEAKSETKPEAQSEKK